MSKLAKETHKKKTNLKMEIFKISRNFFQVLVFIAMDTDGYVHTKFVHVNTDASLAEILFSEGR